MKESKTLAEFYQTSPRHSFGDTTLVIENQGGKLRGKFVFHRVVEEHSNSQEILKAKGLPDCFGRPPAAIDSDVVSKVVWDEAHRTLADIIPKVEADIRELRDSLGSLAQNLARCSDCPVFERCYRIAEFGFARRQNPAAAAR